MLTDTFEIRSNVGFADHDMFGHMTNSRYASFTEMATENLLIRTGLEPLFKHEGWQLQTVTESLLYHRMMQFPWRFSVMTKSVGWAGDRIGFSHEFHARKKLRADSRAVLRLMTKTGAPVEIEHALKTAGHDCAASPLPGDFLATPVPDAAPQ